METPPNPHQNIHPASLLESFEPVLRKRMGDRSFETRLTIEKRVNPSGPAIFSRLLNRFMHGVYLTTLNVSLSLMGKRRRSVENCWKTRIILNTFALNKFSQGPSVRILHLSDFHLDTKLEQAASWASQIEPLEYDIAVITGDFLNGYRLPDIEELDALRTVIQAIRKPVYGILGNHDCMLITPFLEETGITMLLNESVETEVHGIKLLVTGLDDSHLFQADDLEFATRELKPDANRYALNLVLAHSPKKVRALAKAGYDLCLSGHTHGGQLCTSQGLPLLRNGLYHADTVAGKWELDSLHGYTSRGTGTGRLAFRLNCQPEIVLHEIRGF